VSIIVQVFYTLYHAAKTDIKLIIPVQTMTSEQTGLIVKQFSSLDEIRHKEEETFEEDRIGI
jgi:hypothetical protein